MGIAEEGFNAEDFVEPVMFGELVSIVEADGFTHRPWKLVELAGDRPSGADSFSIDWLPNHAEAGLSFVENQQPLAGSGEQHEVGLPMARRLATLNLGRSFGDRAPLFNDAGGGASLAPPCSFVARQQAIPGILLGRAMIDETID